MAPARQTTLAGFFESSSPPKPKDKKPGARSSAAIDLTSDGDDEPPKKRAKVSKDAPTAGPSKPAKQPQTPRAAHPNPTYSEFFSPEKDAPSSKRVARTAADLSSDDEPAPAASTKSKPAKASTTRKVKSSTSIKQNPALAFSKSAAKATTSTAKGKTAATPIADAAGDEDGSDADGVTVDIDDLNSNKFKAFAHASKSKTGDASGVGPSGKPYTPLEKQVMQIKDQYPGVLLLFEIGYKYRCVSLSYVSRKGLILVRRCRFYGEDAQVSIVTIFFFPLTDGCIDCCSSSRVCVLSQAKLPLSKLPFAESVPARQEVRLLLVLFTSLHGSRLLSLGHKVGVIGQAETAALKKAGSNRNSLFERKLLHMWTSATYVCEFIYAWRKS